MIVKSLKEIKKIKTEDQISERGNKKTTPGKKKLTLKLKKTEVQNKKVDLKKNFQEEFLFTFYKKGLENEEQKKTTIKNLKEDIERSTYELYHKTLKNELLEQKVTKLKEPNEIFKKKYDWINKQMENLIEQKILIENELWKKIKLLNKATEKNKFQESVIASLNKEITSVKKQLRSSEQINKDKLKKKIKNFEEKTSLTDQKVNLLEGEIIKKNQIDLNSLVQLAGPVSIIVNNTHAKVTFEGHPETFVGKLNSDSNEFHTDPKKAAFISLKKGYNGTENVIGIKADGKKLSTIHENEWYAYDGTKQVKKGTLEEFINKSIL